MVKLKDRYETLNRFFSVLQFSFPFFPPVGCKVIFFLVGWDALQDCPKEGRYGRVGRMQDRNMPTQHIATLLGATSCVRLATVLRCVAICWVLLAQI